MYAAQRGQSEVVKLLLDEGADLNVKNIYGGTALKEAKIAGYSDIINILLEAGAR
jgi:ankyrin repeat protein